MGQAKAPKKPMKNAAKKTAAETKNISDIKKVYLKNKSVCKVTFKLPKIAAKGAKSVCLVGDFNNWSIYENPMKKSSAGDYSITLELETNREYSFRYLIDETVWENDWHADKYVKNPYGDSDNSVVIT